MVPLFFIPIQNQLKSKTIEYADGEQIYQFFWW